MILITYLPFYRVHEVMKFFIKNMEIVKPDKAIIYIDNVYSEDQVALLRRIIPSCVEFIGGNWRNRSGTWFRILRDMHSFDDEILVVDSDDVLDEDFLSVHQEMKKFKLYTIADHECFHRNPMSFKERSVLIDTFIINGEKRPLYLYNVKPRNLKEFFSKGSPFFIGPKQAVYISKPFSLNIVKRVEEAFKCVDPSLRNNIADEAVLGVILYLSGIEKIPWTIASHHYRHGSYVVRTSKTYLMLTALAHIQFSKCLLKEFRKNVFMLYKLKYILSFLKNVMYILAKEL